MTTEDYVSYETVKLLKEKGFDAECKKYYNLKMLTNLYYGCEYVRNKDLKDEDDCIAPTLQMAMKWLREGHKLHVDIDPSEGDWNPTVITLKDWTCAVKFGDNIPIQDSYEQACEAAIKYCLENLI